MPLKSSTGPIAVFALSETPKWQNPPENDTIVGVGTVITFNPQGSSDPTGTIVKYGWNFGDGSAIVISTTNKLVNHIFKVDGAYTVTLTLMDNNGLQGPHQRLSRYVPAQCYSLFPTIADSTMNRTDNSNRPGK